MTEVSLINVTKSPRPNRIILTVRHEHSLLGFFKNTEDLMYEGTATEWFKFPTGEQVYAEHLEDLLITMERQAIFRGIHPYLSPPKKP